MLVGLFTISRRLLCCSERKKSGWGWERRLRHTAGHAAGDGVAVTQVDHLLRAGRKTVKGAEWHQSTQSGCGKTPPFIRSRANVGPKGFPGRHHRPNDARPMNDNPTSLLVSKAANELFAWSTVS